MGGPALLVATGAFLVCAYLGQSKALSLNRNWATLDESRYEAPSDVVLSTVDSTATNQRQKSETSSTLNPTSVSVDLLGPYALTPSSDGRTVAPSGAIQDITADKIPGGVTITMELRTFKIQVAGGTHVDKSSGKSSTVASTNVSQNITADGKASEAIEQKSNTFNAQIVDTHVENPPRGRNMVATTDAFEIITDGQVPNEAVEVAPRSIDIEGDLKPSIGNRYGQPSMHAPNDVNEEFTEDEMYNGSKMQPRGVIEKDLGILVGNPYGGPTIAPNDVIEFTEDEMYNGSKVQPRGVIEKDLGISVGNPYGGPTIAPNDVIEFTEDEMYNGSKVEPQEVNIEKGLRTPVGNPYGGPNMHAPNDVIEEFTAEEMSNGSIVQPKEVIIEKDLGISVGNPYGGPTIAPNDVNEEFTEEGNMSNGSKVEPKGDNIEKNLGTSAGNPYGGPIVHALNDVIEFTEDEMYNGPIVEPRTVNIEQATIAPSKPFVDPSTVARKYVQKVTLADNTSCKTIAMELNPVNVQGTAIEKFIGEQSTIIIQTADEERVTESSNITVTEKSTGDQLIESTNTTVDKPTGESSKIQLFFIEIDDTEDKRRGNITECTGISNDTSRNNTSVGVMPRTMVDVTKGSFENESEVKRRPTSINTGESTTTFEPSGNKDVSPHKPSLIVRKSHRKEVVLPEKDAVIRDPSAIEYKYETNVPSRVEKSVEHIAANEGESESKEGGNVTDRVKEDSNVVQEGKEDYVEDDEVWQTEDEQFEEGPSGGRIAGGNETAVSNAEEGEEGEEEEYDYDELFEEGAIIGQNEVVEKAGRVVDVVKSAAVSEGIPEGNKTLDGTPKKDSNNYWRPLQPRSK